MNHKQWALFFLFCCFAATVFASGADSIKLAVTRLPGTKTGQVMELIYTIYTLDKDNSPVPAGSWKNVFRFDKDSLAVEGYGTNQAGAYFHSRFRRLGKQQVIRQRSWYGTEADHQKGNITRTETDTFSIGEVYEIVSTKAVEKAVFRYDMLYHHWTRDHGVQTGLLALYDKFGLSDPERYVKKKTRQRNIALVTFAVLVLGGLGYYAYRTKKRRTQV
jgi:hypothetical protein